MCAYVLGVCVHMCICCGGVCAGVYMLRGVCVCPYVVGVYMYVYAVGVCVQVCIC